PGHTDPTIRSNSPLPQPFRPPGLGASISPGGPLFPEEVQRGMSSHPCGSEWKNPERVKPSQDWWPKAAAEGGMDVSTLGGEVAELCYDSDVTGGAQLVFSSTLDSSFWGELEKEICRIQTEADPRRGRAFHSFSSGRTGMTSFFYTSSYAFTYLNDTDLTPVPDSSMASRKDNSYVHLSANSELQIVFVKNQ
ncbi:hypothetical protein MC885_014294, partial [Smutsia gigantea]